MPTLDGINKNKLNLQMTDFVGFCHRNNAAAYTLFKRY